MSDELIRCTDLPGGCCDSCHDEWAEGYGDPIETYNGNKLVALTCCFKVDAAETLTDE